MTKDVTEDVTVLVFKDNYAARTFQVPLKWISRFGVILWFCTAVSLISTILGVKYYRTAKHADPIRVRNLESELTDLRASYHSLELKTLEPKTSPSGLVQELGPVIAQPIPTVTVTASAPLPTAAASAVLPKKSLLFSAVPSNIQPAPANAAEIPITLNGLKATWMGKTLRVYFNIQYTRKDGGAQQGRIVILARGPDTFFSYPAGTLAATDSESLILPNAGEYFSVSRFRETKAEFGPVRNSGQLKTVEVILFSNTGQILIHQKANVSAAPAQPAAPKPDETVDQPVPTESKESPIESKEKKDIVPTP